MTSPMCPVAQSVPYQGTCKCGRYDHQTCENCAQSNYCRSIHVECRSELLHLLYAAHWKRVRSMLPFALEYKDPDAALRHRWSLANRSDVWNWTVYLAMTGVIPALAKNYNDDCRLRNRMSVEELRTHWNPSWDDVEARWSSDKYVLPP